MSTKNRILLFLTMLAMLSVLTGCGQSVTQSDEAPDNESLLYSFEFQVEDAYALTIGGVVVTGYVQSGTMCTGDSAWLVKEDGTVLETGIAGMEIFSKEKDGTIFVERVEVGIPTGVLLEGLEKDQVDAGDILLGKGK